MARIISCWDMDILKDEIIPEIRKSAFSKINLDAIGNKIKDK